MARQMSRRWLAGSALLLIAGALLTPAWVRADGGKEKPAATLPALSLHDRMEAMGDLWDKLDKQAKKNELNKASAELVLHLQAHAALAKHTPPKAAQKLTGDAQAQFLLAFRKQLNEVIGQLMQLELALVEGRNADAATAMKTIGKTMEQAHEKFDPAEKK